MKHRLTLIIAATCLGMTVHSQTVIKPQTKLSGKSFGIIADTRTWNACSKEIREYAGAIEDDGLPSFIVYDDWKTPEQVKKAINSLYKKSRIEGVVFIGDVPVPMIRKAQHLTSAFKMDEEQYPYIESSVPSDRFYDDFDLRFDFIRRDSVNPLLFYYELSVDSPQEINCDIYSGRIRGVGKDADQYDQIRKYLKKAVAAHKEPNRLDQFFSYTGEGSYSNSLTAWTPEMYNLRHQMPGTFDSPVSPGRARFMRYNFSDYPKEDVINMMKREDLDLTIFHEHGMPERQYLSGYPVSELAADHQKIVGEMMRRDMRRASSKEDRDKLASKWKAMGLDSIWWGGYDEPELIKADSISDVDRGIVLGDVNNMAPNSRMVIFDACYNGDFREPDYIAGRYIMAPGKTVVAFANTVNVLQDKQANELLGLLWAGARVGQWAQLTNILESHISGDPTFRFSSSAPGIDASELLSERYDEKKMLALLDSEYSDLRASALHRLYDNGFKDLPTILVRTFRTSPAPMERYTAFHLLEKLNGNEFREILPETLDDTYEFIRREGVTKMGKTGLDEFIPLLVKAYSDDNMSARITFNVERAMSGMNGEVLGKALSGTDDEAVVKLKKSISGQKEADKTILDRNASPKWRKLYIKSLRNTPIHGSVPEYLGLIISPDESEDIKLAMIEALGWYGLSCRKSEIMDACLELAKRKDVSKAVAEAAQRTYNRLK